jgi:coproporphyrinogen III oxidase-like Fe-S oxidoreductase
VSTTQTGPLPNAVPQAADEQKAFGVYIHWPFCLSKCPYCDFNSHVRHAGIDEARFVRAFTAEIAATAARVPGRTVSTIFIGGGTPSLMQPATVAAVLDTVARHWRIAPDAEVTLEANPTSVEATRFRGYRAAGVNRVSLGVQALDDGALAELGRLHSAREALDAVGVARGVFDRYSFDLIYARPRQTPRDWASELRQAIAEAGEHLSLYQLTIEQETPFAALHAAGKLKTPDEDVARALYDTTRRSAPRTACPPTRFPTMRAPAANAGTISSTGGRTNMPASGLGPTGASTLPASATPPRRRNAPRHGSRRSRRAGTGSPPTTCSRARKLPTNSCSWVCGSAKASTWNATPPSPAEGSIRTASRRCANTP